MDGSEGLAARFFAIHAEDLLGLAHIHAHVPGRHRTREIATRHA